MPSVAVLLVRQVNLGRRVLVEAAVLDVTDDADDRLRSVARVARELRADSNLLSNGVLSREVSPCGRSLMRTTSGLVAVSRLSNGRPARIGILIIRKYSGLTIRIEAVGIDADPAPPALRDESRS